MIPPKRPKMMQVISVKQNVSRMAKSVVALRRKVRATLYGLPEDQTTAAERKIVRDYPQYFENDRGYIKVKITGKRRARNALLKNYVVTVYDKSGRKIFSTHSIAETAAYAKKGILNFAKREYGLTGLKATVKLGTGREKNPYQSEAQRRKFHAMAERGEISQAVVNEYDKESKGKRLPEKINGSKYGHSSFQVVFTLPGQDRPHTLSVYASTKAGARQQVKNTYPLAKIERVFLERIKRNATADDFKSYQKVKLQDLVRKFQGHANGLKHRVLQSDLTPKNKYLLGCLALMKVKANGKIIPIEFSGAAYLAADLRNNLHAVGKDAIIENVKKPNPGQLKELGKLIQIDYITAKSHIENGETVRFWHKLAEVDGQYPTLYIDHDGFPIINGGGYDIWSVGIVN